MAWMPTVVFTTYSHDYVLEYMCSSLGKRPIAFIRNSQECVNPNKIKSHSFISSFVKKWTNNSQLYQKHRRCLLKCRFLRPIPDSQNQNRNVHFLIKCKLFFNRKCILIVWNLKGQKGKVSPIPVSQLPVSLQRGSHC